MLPTINRLKLPVKWNRYPDRDFRTNFFKIIAKKTSSDETPVKVGFIITTKVGKATERNQVKRKLSTLLTPKLEILEKGLEVIIIVYPSILNARDEELITNLDKGLSKISIT